jgi:2',3'-cyclic-nucleotide 2'-phosphodiesterase (5'-nucleotidase family)
MAFGVLYDFTTNAEGTRVRRAVDVVKESWFLNAINYKEHIDMFIILGHNPVNTSNYQSTFSTYYDAIRKDKPDTPIQVFGGHTHHREFVVYDSKSTALSSG